MEDALALHAALSSASAPPVARSALAVLSDALRMYGPLDVVVSFNGGKDATVVAHLCRAAFAAHARAAGVAYTPPQAVYWEEEHMFPELDAFVRASAKRYGFNLITYSSGFVEGLQGLVSERARPPALVLGTRATDPNGVSATPFEPSSPSWPAFMRINPILNWSYADVWTFLRGNGLAYCSLYDLGYTSLGNSTNSVTNPARHHASSRGPFGIAPGPALAFGVGERGDIGGGGSRETRVAQSGAGQRLECAGGAGDECAGQTQSERAIAPTSAVDAPRGHAAHALESRSALKVPMPHAAQASPGCNSVLSKPARHTQRPATSAELEGHAHSSADVLRTVLVAAPKGHDVQLIETAPSENVPRSHTAQLSPSTSVPAGHAQTSEPLTTVADISGSAHAHADAEVDPAGLLAPAGQSVQDTAPLLSPKVLAGQGSHSGLMPLGPYVPAAQSVHALAPAALVRPPPHAAQSPAEVLPAPATKVPAGHSAHCAAPTASAYVPARRRVDWPADDWWRPLAHGSRVDEAVAPIRAEEVPAGHSLQPSPAASA
eukprot:PRCOL_00006213-RA